MNKSVAVIDAKLAVFSVLHTPFSEGAERALEYLRNRQVALYAPGLWWFEVTSVIHRYRFDRLIGDEIASQALEILTEQFGVQPVESPWRSALEWASRLRQRAAYDGFYLAAAEQIRAEFWTADQALFKNARQLGLIWVHWIGEAPPGRSP